MIEVPANLDITDYSDIEAFFLLTNIHGNPEDVIMIWQSMKKSFKENMSLGYKLCFDVIPYPEKGYYKLARDVFGFITPDAELTKSFIVNIY